jgi:hypothetical protein
MEGLSEKDDKKKWNYLGLGLAIGARLEARANDTDA